MLGLETTDDKEVSVLNRIRRWESQQLLYEVDRRHFEKHFREVEMEDCKPVTRPGVKLPGELSGGHVASVDHPSTVGQHRSSTNQKVQELQREMQLPCSRSARHHLCDKGVVSSHVGA